MIDEIELGLHEEAQRNLIRELKGLCIDRHIQIICTTHSSQILSSLPPEGKVFIESVGDKTKIIHEVSSKYATGKLRGKHSEELDILVEDGISRRILESILTHELRSRINIIPIGSSSAVMRGMGSKFLEQRQMKMKTIKKENAPLVCAILDGDKSVDHNNNLSMFFKSIEDKNLEDEGKQWLNEKLFYLPSKFWPEFWVLNQLDDESIARAASEFNTTYDELKDILNRSRRSGKHNEFYTCASCLALSEEDVRRVLIKEAVNNADDYRKDLLGSIGALLSH